MKANELIDLLRQQILNHGDCEVYYSYDGGILIECRDIDYYEDVENSPYYEDSTIIEKAFIINYDES